MALCRKSTTSLTFENFFQADSEELEAFDECAPAQLFTQVHTARCIINCICLCVYATLRPYTMRINSYVCVRTHKHTLARPHTYSQRQRERASEGVKGCGTRAWKKTHVLSILRSPSLCRRVAAALKMKRSPAMRFQNQHHARIRVIELVRLDCPLHMRLFSPAILAISMTRVDSCSARGVHARIYLRVHISWNCGHVVTPQTTCRI